VSEQALRARPPLAWQAGLSLLLRLLLAALMIFAGQAKLRDTAAFAEEIQNYRLLPELAPLVSLTLPMVELFAGALLLSPRGVLRQGAALLNLGLMLFFTAAVTSTRLRGIDLSCGCFGTGSSPVTWLTVLRDLLLSAWCLAIVWLERAPKKE
jgi:putative oxidoreductase